MQVHVAQVQVGGRGGHSGGERRTRTAPSWWPAEGENNRKEKSRPATFRVTTRLDLVSPDLFAQPTAHVAHEADVVQREQREDLVRVRMKVLGLMHRVTGGLGLGCEQREDLVRVRMKVRVRM